MCRKKNPYARERPVTVAFRMSKEAVRKLDAFVSLSGLTKKDYIECRLTNQSVTVYPSSHIARSLSCWMQSIYRELVIAHEEGCMIDADLLWIARAILEEYGAVASTESIRDVNETMRAIQRHR